MKPKVISGNDKQPYLSWYRLKKEGVDDAGEILAAFHLHPLIIDNQVKQLSLATLPKNGAIYRLPPEIKPQMQRTIIEV